MTLSRRYSLGVTPVVALKARLNGPERLEAGVHRDGDDGDLGLGRIGQRGLGLLDPVVVEEDIEVAIAEPLVDQPPQPVFGNRRAWSPACRW